MKKTFILFLALGMVTSVIAQNLRTRGIYKAEVRPVWAGLNLVNEIPSFNGPLKTGSVLDSRDIQKISMSSSLNVNGIFDYDERYLTIMPNANLFTFGNRAGGVFGNTGNDLKFKYTIDGGTTWDSAVVLNQNDGQRYRYPSMVTYNPGSTTNPHDMYGIFSGPITDGSVWIQQYYGSTKLDGTNQDINYVANPANTYLNHLDISLYCSPDGHATVASTLLLGTSAAYTYNGFNILNGVFNPTTFKFDWNPFISLQPLLKQANRTDAPEIAWSIDGSIGYFVCTAIDSDLVYNPYGVEWPVIYKTTDHGLTWVKAPPYDFSHIGNLHGKLYSTLADTNVVIPRWFNKWADTKNEDCNGAVVDKYGNLHIFGFVRGTMSTDPDSLNYFYSSEPTTLWDVFMTPYGEWNAIYVDTLKSLDASAGTYGIGWYHQCQMTRSPDGSKVFCLWTDTDVDLFLVTENQDPDIKGMGIDVDNWYTTAVKDFTTSTAFWGDNFWMRVATDVFYDAGSGTYTFPVTTSILGATNNDPLVHQYVTGLTMLDNDFQFFVGTHEKQPVASNISGNRPNPFHGSTEITVNLQASANVSLTVSSVLGKQISTVNYGTMTAGNHNLTINGSTLSSGVYLYTVQINGDKFTNKMIVK